MKTLAMFISSLIFYPLCLVAESTLLDNDPHYNEIGFFDIHICNWPQRNEFFKVLFSSAHFNDIDKMDVYTPDNRFLVSLDKNKFRILKRKNKADKHVYMLDIDIPDFATTGWYEIRVTTKDGRTLLAKDYVIMSRLERITQVSPENDSQDVTLPLKLEWQAVPGAKYYQVFIRDEWSSELVYSSKLLDKTEISLPEDKLEAEGYYSWSVHARDSNEHILLGDFHMGSISDKFFFTVRQ